MYFNEKEDTNIDEEFKEQKESRFRLSKPIIIAGIIILIIIVLLILIASLKKRYFITLDGEKQMTVYKGTTYNEPGYKGFDNKNNTYDVTVEGNVDTSEVGTYIITYKLKNTTVTRTVEVIEQPNIATAIHLKGEKNITIAKGSTFTEPGYTAIDAIDGDLTAKVTITGKVDTTKAGTYRITYSVVNSKGVTASESRVVIVK